MQTKNCCQKGFQISKTKKKIKQILSSVGQGLLFLITSSSVLFLFFIFYYIIKEALPFIEIEGIKEFFTCNEWYPSRSPDPQFGALAILFGSFLVTAGATIFSVPLGITAAICISDIIPFSIRKIIKPIIELLSTIPSVAFGFWALVILAPLLQNNGSTIIKYSLWIIGVPTLLIISFVGGDILSQKVSKSSPKIKYIIMGLIILSGTYILYWIISPLNNLEISSGTNALNVSFILGIMALPTIISVSEDALGAVEKEQREASYALGATRTETLLKVVVPAAKSGILAAIMLGIMRAVGETMVVWMASGNSAQIPTPWFDLTEPVRTLTATIAGDMGEADHVTGSARYHVLFVMSFVLITISFICNWISIYLVKRK